MEKEEIVNLIERYNSGSCSEEERTIVESWYLQYKSNSTVELTDQERMDDLHDVFNKIQLPQNTNKHRVFPLYQIVATAAAVLIMVLGVYYYKLPVPYPNPKSVVANKILPGGAKATLTLSDGSKIILDDAKKGVLANQSGVSIQKAADGQLIYSVSDQLISTNQSDKEPVYNKIETPVGGSYQINLPDGTKVWLNAASSLSFPAKFSNKRRTVKLTGEAYFDVKENKHAPFIVTFNGQVVEVLGTQFNISSYVDESSNKTTLIEGSVKLSQDNEQVLLKPGQQGVYEMNKMRVVTADLERTLAWKNGYFMFKNEDIRSIMRKIARWYNVEVTYEGKIPEIEFGGSISRSKDILEVLKALQLTNSIHFKIEERRITVMP